MILFVYGPQFDTGELDVVRAFENIFDVALVQLIVDEPNRYAHQEISKSVFPFTFHSGIRRKWENVNAHGFACLNVDGHCTKAYA
jgi:hypothetical protein